MIDRRAFRAAARQARQLSIDADKAATELLEKGLADLYGELNAYLFGGDYQRGEIGKVMDTITAMFQRHYRLIAASIVAYQVATWNSAVENINRLMSIGEPYWMTTVLDSAKLDLVTRFTTFDRIGGITAEMQSAISGLVTNGLLQKQTPLQLMGQVQKLLGLQSLEMYQKLGMHALAAKAELIVRTELTTIIGAANQHTMGQALQKYPDLQKVWLTVGDMAVRDAHAAAHGQTRPVSEPFSVGGWAAMFPGDPSLPMSLRANCRCWPAPLRDTWGDVTWLLGPLIYLLGKKKEKALAEA